MSVVCGGKRGPFSATTVSMAILDEHSLSLICSLPFGLKPGFRKPYTGCFKNTGHNFRSFPSKETLRGHSDSSLRDEGYIQCCVGFRLCDMYSNQELAEIHFMYGKVDGNAALARRLYQERYPQRQCPDRKTFVRLHYRPCEYGKFNSMVWEGDDQDLQLQKYRRRFWRL
ncbi:hypothetical protein ANN_06479 [Periplaneta americana]|uniref:DUF4817 domain-containing protein n=1 Tax=Periplaneta americana TaxID=6978 RepID=A0ABQ8TFF9_PERAM|nr:hypothetical protein ANN_06479 [Periplaneta americana]